MAALAGVVATDSPAFADDPPRFVRLSIMLEPDWTATISWETNGNVPGEVQFGVTQSYDSTEAAFPALPGPTGFSHFVVAQGLDPATTYHYRVGNATDGYSPDFTFTTAPDSQCEPITFVAVGESRASVSGAATDWPNVLGQAKGENPGFIMHTGDLVANGAFLAQWNDFFDKSAAVIPLVPLMSAIGPADVAIDIGDDALYNKFFAFPRNDYTDTEDFYSFDYGSVHVSVISTETFNEQNYADQALWLDDDLSFTDRIWKVVLLNRPPYSSGGFGSDKGNIIPYLTDIFDKYNVDIVLGSYDHHYERFKPMKGGQEVASYDGATLHVVTGGGGAPVDPLFPSRPKLPTSAVTDNKNHYVIFSVNGTTLQMKAVRVPGGFQGGTGVIDELEFKKTVTPDPCPPEPDAGVLDAGQDAGTEAGHDATSADMGSDASTADGGLDGGAADSGEADDAQIDATAQDADVTDDAGVGDSGSEDRVAGDSGSDDDVNSSADGEIADVTRADAGDTGNAEDGDATQKPDAGGRTDGSHADGDGANAATDDTGSGGTDEAAGGCSCAHLGT